MRHGSISVFTLLRIFSIISFFQIISVSAFFDFREANEQVRNELKNDRPCNALLDYNDAKLGTPEIIVKYGYPMQRNWVTTDDGYILEVHRIPALKSLKCDSSSECKRIGNLSEPAPAVFLMHGVLSSSRDFVINCDRRALAFKLWENGYDVWLGNARGNKYSRNHTRLDVHESQFWDFSIDEVGYYDVPAMIDHVLNTTKLKKVSYVGHSMGNGVALIMLSIRPEYNEKVNMWFAMSGAVSLQQTSSPVLRIFASIPRTIKWILKTFNHGEFIPYWFLNFLSNFFSVACRRQGRTQNYHGYCSSVFFLFDGYDPGQIPPELYSVAFAGFPTSTSVKYIIQWMQWIISGDFAMFDEGPIKNLRKYGNVKPKRYPIENEKTPIIIYYGQNDWLVNFMDVKKTESIFKQLRLPSTEFVKIASPKWNHADFVFGKDADIQVYQHILERLKLLYKLNAG